MIPLLQIHPALPEILLLSGTVLILLIDLFLKGKKGLTFWLTEILLVAVLACVLLEHALPSQLAFNGQYVFDGFSLIIKAFAVAFTFLLFAYARTRDEFQALRSEYLFLMLLSLLGAMVLASSASLITLYLGLELLSLPLYALVALKRDCPKAGEAALKYFITGALASGFLLYGFSLLYGITGSLYLPQIANGLVYNQLLGTPIFWMSAIFIFATTAFKFGIFPFHMWIPDVYEGAPLPVTAYIATVSKLAAIALFIRLFGQTLMNTAQVMGPIFFWLGVLSLLIGSTCALIQKNLRRFLGYSTIANMGILFIALGLGTSQGYFSALFYVLTYTTASLAAFGLLLSFNRDLTLIDDLKGLHHTKPFSAFLFLLVMLSFAGIPPLLGFEAKFMVILALIHQNHIGLSVLVVVLSVVSAAYALRIIKALYFDAPPITDTDFSGKMSFGRICVALNTLALLAFGIFPLPLIHLIKHIFM